MSSADARPSWGSASASEAVAAGPSRSWDDRFNAEAWRSRPGGMGLRERERALEALLDATQSHLREYGGGLPTFDVDHRITELKK